MPLFSHKQLLNLKLSSIKSENLKELADNLGISPKGSASEIIKRILEMLPLPPENIIDAFIVCDMWEMANPHRYLVGRIT